MKDTLRKLRSKRYFTAIAIVLLLVFVVILFGLLRPVVKNINIKKIVSRTTTLNASVVDGINEDVESNNYDEIKYTIKVNKNASDTAVIIATLTDEESKYARFKEISNSVVSDNGKKITVTTTNEKTNVVVIVENAPYGSVITPYFKINSEDPNKANISVDPVTITGKSVEGSVIDENGTSMTGIELSLKSNSGEIKRTYTKDNGNYVFSLGDTENYQISLEEPKYKVVRYEDLTTDENRRILNVVVKEVDPFNIKVSKTINKLDLVVNGKKQTFKYDDESKVVRSVKEARTIEGSIYYKITVKNEGEIKGTLTVLKDIVPEGLSFDESKNPGWTKEGNYLFYTPLEGREIGPFEQANISLVLDIVKTEEAKSYINTAISSGEDYKYVVYYLNNNVFREEYVIESEKVKDIDPGDPDFLGWYTDRNYTNKYDFNTPVTKDLILYGKLKNSKYNVTFIDRNPNTGTDTILEIKEVEDGNPVEVPTAPEYNGYTFKCFTLNNNCYNGEEITHDTELYTSYTTNKYNIVYDLDGGSVSEDNPVEYTVKDEFTLNNPTKLGFTFIGWTGTNLTEETLDVTISKGSIGDREYTANYVINKATLRVNPNGGLYNGSINPIDLEDDYGAIITLNTPTKEGYTFTGWTLTGDGALNGNTYTYSTGNGEVVANYEPVNYNISYNLDDGVVETANPTTYTIESDNITLNNPTKKGYTFTGWTGTGLDNKTLNVVIPTGSTGDREYTANYEINKYTLTVNPNGGTYNGSSDSVNIENDYGYILTLDNPSKTGYNFTSWSLTGKGSLLENVYTYSDGNGEVTANYEVITYNISYEGLTNDEISAINNPITYTVEDEITLTNPSDRLDSDGDIVERFTGWTIDGSTSIVGTIPRGSTGNKTFTANFTHVDPDTYTITYNLNGGSVAEDNPTSYTKKTNTFTLNNPTKEGYDFAGWTGTGLNEPTITVTIPRLSTGDREYTATYTPKSYNITYNGLTNEEKASINNPDNYNIETDTFTLTNPSRTGYTFLGWTGSNGDTPGNVTIEVGSTGNKEYTANFETITYNLTYDLNGGSVSEANPSTYNIESNAITLNNPTKEGYDFTGWTGTGLSEPTVNVTIPTGSIEDREYTANYSPKTYTITYEGLTPEEITALGNPTTYTIETNSFSLTNPSRTGYTFLGWTGSNGDTPGNVSIPIGTTGNKTYTANFTDDDYTISYTLNGGLLEPSKTNPTHYSIETDTFTLNNPSKTGYNFTGWSGTDIVGTSTTVTVTKGSIGNRSYTANYEPIVYNITYDYDGGTVETANPTTYTIESDEIVFNTPSKEGYTFTNYTINDQIATSIPTGSTGDKHLVAHYEIRKYNVNFYNGTSIFTNEEVSWNDKASIPPDIPTKEHGIFLYWSEDGTNEYDFDTLITDNKNLYAVYEIVEAPTITISPDLDSTTNKTYVCGDSTDSNCGVTITVTSTHPDYELYYKVGDGTPILYTEPVKVYSNETITAFAKKNNIYSLDNTKDIENVDTIVPTIGVPETGATSFDITVSGTSSDSGSGVKKITVYLKEKTALDYDDTNKCETEVFDGVKDQAESYSCSFTGIKDATEYTAKIVSEDYVGNINELEVDTETKPYVARIVGMNNMLWYTIDPDTKEMVIDDGKEFLMFGSIQAAINYCQSNQCTVQTNPINPVTNENSTIGDNQNITIDLDGRGITSDASSTFVNNGTLVIVDRNPRETIDHEHDGIGFVKNTTNKAIVNNGTFTLGEGSAEESATFIVPEMDRPIIEGKTTALENNDKFNFFDGKLISEGTVITGTGEDAVTQFMYNAILSGEGDKNVAILDRATDPEAKIKSTYYAKLKITNGDNAFDSSRKGSLSKDEYKILSKIKQAGDYGFVYDAVNNEIYNGNQTTSNTTALSYIKLDLTDELNDQIIVFDTFADTYNSNSYGYISVSETLANTGTQIYKAYGNDKVSGKVYGLEKGKVYYIYFGFVKGAGDTNTYETFKVTNFNILGERESSSNLVLMNDPLYYSFDKQSDGSFISTNKGINNSYSHSYAVYDLSNTSDQYNLNISASISSQADRDYGYIYLSDSDTLHDVNTGTGRYMLISGEVEENTISIPLTPGQLNYVNFVYYKNGSTHTGDDNFIINNISITKLETEDLIPTTNVEHGSSDTYYFKEVNGNPYIWVDRSGHNNNADIYSNVYDPDNYGFTFNNYSHMAISGSNLGLTNYEESVYLEYSTESTGNAILYMGSTNERLLIGVYSGRVVVSNAGTVNTYTLPSDYADGNKHSFLATYNDGNYELYYDGVLLEKLSYTDRFTKADGNIHLGRRGNGEYPFYGKIYNFKIFNKELTPEELDNTENLVINLDGTNPFTGDGHQYYSNNRLVSNSTAHSYIPYDLTNIDQDKYLYINTRISSQANYDYGYIYVTNSPDLPSGASGRAITLSGDYADRNLVVRLKKNQMNYVHFVYTKNGSNDYYTDTFYIKEMKYFNNEVDAYSYDPAAYQMLDTYYFDKPVYNQTVDTIELLKDVTINTSIVVPEEQEVILDLNGFTLTSEKNDYIIKNNGKLTITDSELEERRSQNVDYITEQARLYNEAKTQYLADKAEYEEYAGLCENCEPSDEYKFDRLPQYADYFGLDLDPTDSSNIEDIDFTGSEEEYNVQLTGVYKLETWGAQGGSSTGSNIGGYGGYSVGVTLLNAGDKLYINVGGAGSNSSTEGIPGGYNGGGAGQGGYCNNNSRRTGASGGGATSITTSTGLLSTLEDNKDSVLIVAGGGGGGFDYGGYGTGGSAGGYVGNTATFTRGNGHGRTIYATGGSQTEGGLDGNSYSNITQTVVGAFGQGGNRSSGVCSEGSGGGGGFYGGGSAGFAPGAGGSSYIGNSLLSDKQMVCYNCTVSDDINTKTVSNTCVDSNPTADCAKEGNGYARITMIAAITPEQEEQIRNNFPKTYTVKENPEFKDYLTGIDFDSSIDINTLTPDSDVSFNKAIDESHVGGITTTLASAILNEQYGILTLKNIAINVNVDSKIGIENRGSLFVSDLTEINANNTSTIGIFNESNGSLAFNDSVINANGSSTIGLLNRSNTPLIDGVKVTTATTNGTGIRDESIDFVRYNNIDLSGAGLAFSMYSNAGDSSITNSNLKSTGNESFYLEGEGKQNKLTISNTNFNGRFYINRSPIEIVISNSTLSSVLNTIGNITINSSSLNDIINRGMARINNSTITSTGTAINNQGNPEHGDAEQFIANMIINNSVINSTATSAANVISNSDRLNVHNTTINNINGTKSTAFNNASATGATAYLTIDGNTTIDSSFGTAINNTGLLTLGSNKNGIGEVYNYGYIGHQEEFVAPVSGTYKLETWGASGGESPHSYGEWRFAHGGFGGYASGTITLNAGDKLYIHVGGVGSEGVVYSTSYPAGGYNLISYYGSYNGGGALSGNLGTRKYGGSGGGATDISLSDEDNTWSYDNGVATNTRSNSSYEQRIVVAGGGSGGGTGSTTKYGGYTGDSSTSQLGFGSSGGGGGYYGGTYNIGGSSYVSDTLTDIVMIDGNNDMPNYDSAGIVRGNVGNGYAKITLIDTSNTDTVDSSPTISATNYGITGTGRIVYYDGTISANKAFNTSIESVPDNYDIYKSIDGDTENVVLVPNSDVRPVSPGEEEYVCKIGGTKYTTIQNAVDAANTGDTIELLVDINQQNMITVPDGKNLTIDYNGHTVISYNNNALFNITSTSTSDSDPGITIKDSQRALLDNYGYGNTYIINDGKLSIENLKFYDRGKQKSFIENNGKLVIKSSDIYYGQAGQNNGTAIKNNVNGDISIIDSNTYVYNANHADNKNTIIKNDGIANIKDTSFIYNRGGGTGPGGSVYFVYNNATGTMTLDNTSITFNNRGWYESYNYFNNAGDLTIKNHPSFNPEGMTNTGTITLENNTFTAGTLSSSGSSLVRINSGTYSNTFNISGTGKTIDDTDNLYSLIMEDGTINKTLNLSSTGISNIKGGTISVDSGYAINNTGAGIITLGINDSSAAPKADTRPIISGATYGIYTNNPNAVINFYDGIVSGQTAYNLTVDGIETGYSLRRDYDSDSDREEKYLTNEPMFTNVTQGINYATVAEFNNAINNGSINNDDEIIVYRNITITKNDPTIVIPSGLNITFDLNGKVIDKGNNLMFENNGTLTINDSITDSTGKIDSTSGNIIENNGTLNILKGTYISQRESKETAIIMNALGSTLNISDGNFTKYYDKLDELNQQDRGFGSIINNSGDVTITGGHYTINSSHRGGYLNRIANYIYTSNLFWNTSTGVINASNITADGFASVDINADNKAYGSSISYQAEGQMFHNDGILNISDSVSTNSLIGDNTGTVVMENVTMNKISNINNIWDTVRHKPIVNSGTFTIKGGNYTTSEQIVKNTGTFIITLDSLGNGTTVTRNGNGYVGRNNQGEDSNSDTLIYNKTTGNVEIDGATFLADSISTSAIVANSSSGQVNISNSILKTNNYPTIINNASGIINVNNSTLTTKAHNTINNNSTGTVSVYGDSTEVITDSGIGILNNSTGTINLGKLKTEDASLSQTNPLVVGSTYGVSNTKGTFNFYDGILKGKTAAKTGSITNIEPNYSIIEPTDPVDEYYVAYLDRIYVVENANDSTKKYYSIADAFDDAIGGEEYKMIANYSTTIDIPTATADNNVTLDLNGYTITQGNSVLFTNNSNLTIVDSSTNKTGSIVVASGSKAFDNYGTLNLNAGNISTNSGILFVTNNTGATLNIRNHAKLDSTVRSTLIDNSGTTNIYNGAYLHTVNHNVIINRNLLNIIDLNNDDDNSTSSEYDAPWIYCPNNRSGGSYHSYDDFVNSSIENKTGATVTIYGGIYNNGQTYDTGSPNLSSIIRNYGTANIYNLNNYSFVLGYNAGNIIVNNSHFYNFANYAISNEGTITMNDTFIETTATENAGTDRDFTMVNYGTINLNNVSVTTRTQGYGRFSRNGTFNITDSNINFSTNSDYGIRASNINVTNSTINCNTGISATNLNVDSSDISSSSVSISSGGNVNIKNGSNVTSTGGNAINTTGTLNILDNSRVVSTNGYGIYLDGNGTLNIGEIGGTPSVNDPYIEGSTYGVYRNTNTSRLNFYDGLVVGQTGPNAIYGGVTNVEGGYETTDIVDTDDNNRHHEFLVVSATSVAIAKVGTYTFSSNGSINSSQALQNAINFAIGDGTNVKVVDLVADVDLTSDEVSLTATSPVTINLNGKTITSDSTYTIDSNINTNSGNLGGSISKLLSNTFGVTQNPKNIIIYELSDGSHLDVTKTYKLLKDGNVVKLEKEELGRYKYQGDNENLVPIKGRLYIDNLSKGSYRLESSDNKYIEFSIDSDGNISGNVTENAKDSDSSSAIAKSNAELIIQIQTGLERHYYLLFILPVILIIILLMVILKNKKREIV